MSDPAREAQQIYDAYNRALPDARLARPRRTVRGPGGSMEECFCVNCGASGGFVTEAAIPYVFYLCDDCVAKHGRLPLPEVPEDIVRGHVAPDEGG